MAKKTTAKKPVTKKPRRRLKRTARRSLAAVLMITAVIVAAIPVPENAAAPKDGISAYADTPTDVHEDALKDKFKYDAKGKEVTGIQTATWAAANLNVFVKTGTDGQSSLDEAAIMGSYNGTDKTKPKVNAAMTVRKIGGEDALTWQFMYYVANLTGSGTSSSDDGAVICRYNGAVIETGTVDLPMFLNTEYYTVEKDVIDNYFKGLSPDGKTLGSADAKESWADYVDRDPNKDFKYTYEIYQNSLKPNAQGDILEFFNTYFSNDDAFVALKNGYAAYDAALNDGSGPAPDESLKNATLERAPEDITNHEDQIKFYTAHDNVLRLQTGSYELVAVKDLRPDSSTDLIYVAKGGEPGTGYYKDDNGYLVKKQARSFVCGIGGYAFAGNDRISNLTLDNEINFIGDHAFEGAGLISSIDLNAIYVGNQAFKQCNSLKTLQIGSSTNTIGAECFYGTPIADIKLPENISNIGYGAFAYCNNLAKLDLNSITKSCKIDGYAFYECRSLSTIAMRDANVVSIGDGAFACTGGAQLDFIFPKGMNSSGGENTIGDFMFAGRTGLNSVVFPEYYGVTQSASVELPSNMFHECVSLSYVRFPNDEGTFNCAYVTYDGKKLFADVANKEFYVEGPAKRTNVDPARPRESTWDAVTAVSDKVPYLYHENGKDFYEVSDGFYLLSVEKAKGATEGILARCVSKPKADMSQWKGVLVVPSMVGNTKVKGIGEGCFSDPALNEQVTALKIEDDSIETIADDVFHGGDGKTSNDWLKLEYVYLGNSVREIGDRAFEGCTKLDNIFLNSPNGFSHGDFKLGTNAFKTGHNGLTIHGDIDVDYDPFEWAMNPDKQQAKVRDGADIRPCYKSLTTSYLTVMYDDGTGKVTLMDYPKKKDINKILDEAYRLDILAGPDGSFTGVDDSYDNYVEMRKDQVYAQYRDDSYNDYREAFKTAWMNANTDDEKQAVYASNVYGPWVNVDFLADADTWGTTVDTGTDGALNMAADFLFEPIVAYAAGVDLEPYYDVVEYEIGGSYGTDEERELIAAVSDIVIPEGVQSIDVEGYFKGRKGEDGKRQNPDANDASETVYFGSIKQGDAWDMYTNALKKEDDDPTDTVPGLFSGFYDDGLPRTKPENGEKYEKFQRGNDQILKVTMNSVEYLPDYAFDSCENLLEVNLGPACKDIGTAPFRGCYEMEKVGDNQWYTTVNGIIYSNNTDGSKTIEECLSARGRKTDAVGPNTVNVLRDENIKDVSAIKPGAFEDCDDLTHVLFGNDDTKGLKEIPEDCFRNCDSLQQVELPVTVNDIGRGAFVGAKNLSGLTVYGDEVKISGSAFDKDKTTTTVRAHLDSAVARYVKEYGSQDLYKLVMDETNPLGKQWKVTFVGPDYNVITELTDRKGNSLDNPMYVEDGHSVPQEPAGPSVEGWSFEEWVGTNGVDLKEGVISEDTVFYAQGHYEGGRPVDGKWDVEFFDSLDASRFGGWQDGMYHIEDGKSFADLDIAAPAHPNHTGYEPDGFIIAYSSGGQSAAWTVQTKIDRKMQIFAMYKASATSGNSTNTSGGTTSSGTTNGGTTSGGTTSNITTSSNRNSSSSSSSSSSSTSSSSTSTTSTTSGAGQYTVLVENGSGSGSYAPGATVLISAYAPAAGLRFDKWTTESNGVSLASVSLPVTTFTMPSNNVSVKANYVADTMPQTAAAPGSSGNTNANNSDDGNTRVDIEKPGISNRDLATANVNGSSDNFVIKISETDEATRAVAEALTNKYGTLDNILYYAMDITLWDATGSYQLTGDQLNGISVDITIPIPDSLVAYGGNNMAGAVINGNQLESLNENFTTINGVPCIRFHATHFSPYTIYVDTGNLVEGMLDTTPKTGDPIHPKWFLSLGLACLSIILFLKRDKRKPVK